MAASAGVGGSFLRRLRGRGNVVAAARADLEALARDADLHLALAGARLVGLVAEQVVRVGALGDAAQARPRGRCRRTPSRPSPRRCPRCRRWPRRTRSRPSGSRRDRGRRHLPPSESPSRPRSGWPRSPVARGRSPPRSPASSGAAGSPRRRARATSAPEAGPATRAPAAGRRGVMPVRRLIWATTSSPFTGASGRPTTANWPGPADWPVPPAITGPPTASRPGSAVLESAHRRPVAVAVARALADEAADDGRELPVLPGVAGRPPQLLLRSHDGDPVALAHVRLQEAAQRLANALHRGGRDVDVVDEDQQAAALGRRAQARTGETRRLVAESPGGPRAR